MATKYIDFPLPDVKLTNDHRIIKCEVEYSPRDKAIVLDMCLVTREGSTIGYMLFGAKNRRVWLEDAPRYNAKKVEDIGREIKAFWDKSTVYGQRIREALEYIETNNSVTIAKSDEEAFKVPSFVVGEVVRKIHAATINAEPIDGVVVGMSNDIGGLRYQVLYKNGHLYSYEKAVDTTASLESLGKILSGESVERLLTAHTTKEAQAKALQDQAKAIEEREYETALSALREKYPFAKREGSSYARAAANCKTELQQAFPGVSFSVTTQSYSGGDSMDIKWTDGPTIAEVEAISAKFQEADYMDNTDYVHTKKGPEHRAVRAYLGTCRYVHESREVSQAAVDAVAAAVATVYGEYGGYDHNFGAYRILERSPIYGAFVGICEGEEGKIYATFEANTATATEPEPVTNSEGVTITENPTKNGIEIRFAGKPDDEIRDKLKRNGFRWSKFQKMWYAQVTEARRSFAQQLAGA